MLKKLNSIRYKFIRSHLYALFLTTMILLSFFLAIYVTYEPSWLTATSIFLFVGSMVLVSFFVSLYVGFQSSSDMKERLGGISTLITSLSQGNYGSSIRLTPDDEISRIGTELNELAKKLKSQVKSLQRMADEKSEYAKSAHKAATIEERQRLARDLHDAVSQQLFALTMMSQATLRLFEKDPAKAKQQLEEITSMALQAQTEMRALLLHLRPVHLSGEPLHQGVHNLIKELKQKCQIEFDLEMDEAVGISDGAEEHLFRIVQEALSNILRHSEATEVIVSLHMRHEELFLHIGDNGKGFEIDQDKKMSYGLKTMRERCEEIGGTFAIRSKQHAGTYIDIRIPVQEEHAYE
ncbi:sensor histidine kinase [Pontibacillus yanchengensis]|uniref:Sensor histidine kinase n=2 Tax=Pontibacillus yanchengensis TaxID=462910 RepID=A0ACC7VE08_9BACI|nr:sensor histidine kinase [Pontibacillus yanchengensis]MYL32347.1 sensor histidine kinase [Pontibacillus yanchengensis]MYL52927.1 sensor histidine kinase [Pontibacillus yanchengensis]